VRVLSRGSEQDLIWNYARAEFEVPQDGLRHTQPKMSARLKEKVLDDARVGLTEEEWKKLKAAVLSTRESIVRPLLEFVTDWYVAELEENDWAKIRVMNLHIFTDIEPSRRLDGLARALDGGDVPKVWKPDHYATFRSNFSLAKMHGLPILVAERLAGAFTVVEGTTRMCVIVSKQLRGEIDLKKMLVVLGVSSRLSEWEWF